MENPSSPFFTALVTDTSLAPAYGFQECYIDATHGPVPKVGGRYGTASANPGYPVPTSTTFAVNDVVLCRQADGLGGLAWELSLVGGAAKNPVAVTFSTVEKLPACAYFNGPNNNGIGATLTANANGVLSLRQGAQDNPYTPPVGSLMLVQYEGTGSFQLDASPNNGIYTVTSIGSARTPWVMTRTPGYDTGAAMVGLYVYVERGPWLATTTWIQQASANGFGPVPRIGIDSLWFKLAAPVTLNIINGFGSLSLCAFFTNPFSFPGQGPFDVAPDMYKGILPVSGVFQLSARWSAQITNNALGNAGPVYFRVLTILGITSGQSNVTLGVQPGANAVSPLLPIQYTDSIGGNLGDLIALQYGTLGFPLSASMTINAQNSGGGTSIPMELTLLDGHHI
jgi:hypothetical protein